MTTTQTVRFEGAWTSSEQALIESAAQAAEDGAAPPAARRGYPWACCRVARGPEVFYLAHWSRRPGTVFRAASASELALQMFIA